MAMEDMNLSKTEIEELKRLLKKVGFDDYWWPNEEIMRVAHSVFSMWAVELVIIRPSAQREKPSKQILLSIYRGGVKEFQGFWNIPGGYNKWSHSDIQETCSEIAKLEIGTDVRYRRIINAYKWKQGEHPYGRPLSLFTECEPTGRVVESNTLRFFSKEDLPQKIVAPHLRFIEEFI